MMTFLAFRPVEDLRQTDATINSLTLSWRHSDNVDGFDVSIGNFHEPQLHFKKFYPLPERQSRFISRFSSYPTYSVNSINRVNLPAGRTFNCTVVPVLNKTTAPSPSIYDYDYDYDDQFYYPRDSRTEYRPNYPLTALHLPITIECSTLCEDQCLFEFAYPLTANNFFCIFSIWRSSDRPAVSFFDAYTGRVELERARGLWQTCTILQ